VYCNDEREGPGLLTYADGRCDVGLWKRHKLVRIWSAVDSPFSLSELGYDVTSGPVDRPAASNVKRVGRGRAEILGRCGVRPAKAPFQYPWTPDIDEVAAAVLCDFLPPTCLAADLKALDDAFLADDCVTFNAPHLDTLRQSLGTILDAEETSTNDLSTKAKRSFQYALMADGHFGAAAERAGDKQHRIMQGSLTTKADAQPLLGGSTTSAGVPDTSVHQPSSSSAAKMEGKARASADGGATKHRAKQDSLTVKGDVLGVSSTSPGAPDSAVNVEGKANAAAEAEATKQRAKQDSLAAKADAHSVHERSSAALPKGDARRRSTASSGVSDPAHPRRLSTSAEGDGVVVAESGSGRHRRVSQTPRSVLAGIEAVLRGDHGSAIVDLGVDTSRPGPLQLLSERFITAAGQGDVDTVLELLDGGLVSVDVADSTGLTAVLAASVRILYILAHIVILHNAFWVSLLNGGNDNCMF